MGCQPYEDLMAKYEHKSHSNRKCGKSFERLSHAKKREQNHCLFDRAYMVILTKHYDFF